MLVERSRTDPQTQELFDLESRVMKALKCGGSPDQAALEDVCRDLELAAVRSAPVTSRELSILFQTAMMFAATRVLAHWARSDRQTERSPKLAATVIYRAHGYPDEMVARPCHFEPARTQTRHVHPQPSRKLSTRGIYCTIEARTPRVVSAGDPLFEQHVSVVGLNARTLLFVPIDAPYPAGQGTGAAAAADARRAPDAALVIESDDPRAFDGIIGSPECDAITTLIAKLLTRFAEYRKHRDGYKVLRSCNTVLELLRQDLSASNAFRALLRAASRIAGDADVSLHLRDRFAGGEATRDERDRAIHLAAVYGPNQRGYLIGDRTGTGLVARTVFRGQGSEVLTCREIEEQTNRITSEHDVAAYGYRQLYPNARAEACVPIRFPNSPHIGALNFEWTGSTEVGGINDATAQKSRLLTLLPVLERLADYFTLIIDHFDDLQHFRPVDRPGPNRPSDDAKARAQRYAQHRRILAFHANKAVARMSEQIERGSLPVQYPSAERSLLESIQAHIGYLVRPDWHRRRGVEIRRLERPGASELHRCLPPYGYSVWDPATHTHRHEPTGSIRLHADREDGWSVIESAAWFAVPVAGTVTGPWNGATFERDLGLAGDPMDRMARHAARQLPKSPIRYLGEVEHPWPVYEVATPLIVGGHVMGVLDIDFFDRDEPPRDRTHVSMEPADFHELLEWSRFISFVLALLDDRRETTGPIASRVEPALYNEFVALCLQVVAGASFSQASFDALMGAVSSELVPATQVSAPTDHPAGALRTHDSGNKPKWLLLPDAGGRVREVRVERPAAGVRTPIRPGIFGAPGGDSGIAHVVNSFLRSAYSLRGTLPWRPTEAQPGFQATVQDAKKRLQEALRRPFEATSVRAYIDECFGRFHEALGAAFSVQPEGRTHAWKIYCARRPHGERKAGHTELSCRDGRGGVWAYNGTPDFDSVVVQALATASKETPDWDALFGDDRGEHVESAKRLLTDGVGSRAKRAREALLVAFGGAGYPWPVDRGAPAKSITQSVADADHAYTTPNLRLSPFAAMTRAPYFGSATYAVLACPIGLQWEDGPRDVIGVINIFRRRTDTVDLEFFHPEEIDAVLKVIEVLTHTLVEGLSRCPTEPGQYRTEALADVCDEAEWARHKVDRSDRKCVAVISSSVCSVQWLREAFLGRLGDVSVFDGAPGALAERGITVSIVQPADVSGASVEHIQDAARRSQQAQRPLVLVFDSDRNFERAELPTDLPNRQARPVSLRRAEALVLYLLSRAREDADGVHRSVVLRRSADPEAMLRTLLGHAFDRCAGPIEPSASRVELRCLRVDAIRDRVDELAERFHGAREDHWSVLPSWVDLFPS